MKAHTQHAMLIGTSTKVNRTSWTHTERGRELTEIVDVGLKAILILMISPFDIPPCKNN